MTKKLMLAAALLASVTLSGCNLSPAAQARWQAIGNAFYIAECTPLGQGALTTAGNLLTIIGSSQAIVTRAKVRIEQSQQIADQICPFITAIKTAVMSVPPAPAGVTAGAVVTGAAATSIAKP
ncbi:MAG: hypothetical protein KGQ37_09395 [Hyphomicrobiales bacterium]|nr:hypothetical protein [Hyphomicrobiales bacterium]